MISKAKKNMSAVALVDRKIDKSIKVNNITKFGLPKIVCWVPQSNSAYNLILLCIRSANLKPVCPFSTRKLKISLVLTFEDVYSWIWDVIKVEGIS